MPKYARKRVSRRKYAKKPSTRRAGASRIAPRDNRLVAARDPPQGQVYKQNASRSWNLNSCVPLKMRSIMNLTQNFSISTQGVDGSTLIGTTLYWRLNSLYAPTFSGGVPNTHQPYLYDQMRSLYAVARVYAVKVDITAVDTGNSGASAIVVTTKNGTDVSSPTGEQLFQWDEKPNCTLINVPFQYNTQLQTLSQYYDIAQMFGVTRQAYLTDDEYADVGTSVPNNQMLLGISCGNWNNALGGAMVTLKFTYYVQWSEPFTQPTS